MTRPCRDMAATIVYSQLSGIVKLVILLWKFRLFFG